MGIATRVNMGIVDIQGHSWVYKGKHGYNIWVYDTWVYISMMWVYKGKASQTVVFQD